MCIRVSAFVRVLTVCVCVYCRHAEQFSEAVPQCRAEAHVTEASGLCHVQWGVRPVQPLPAPHPRWVCFLCILGIYLCVLTKCVDPFLIPGVTNGCTFLFVFALALTHLIDEDLIS